jgi:hypothetical protein|tara:strand:- start:14 stop:181 length:168 start_codon:yes stop_codon:yes gene_type:complete
MPRSRMNKIDLEARVYRLKNELYGKETDSSMTGQWYDGAHYTLNKVLDILQEYSN